MAYQNNRGKYIGVVNLGETFSFSFDVNNDVFDPTGAISAWFEGALTTGTDSQLRYSVVSNETYTTVLYDQEFNSMVTETDFDGIVYGSFSVNDTNFNVGSYTVKIYAMRGAAGFGTDGFDSISFIFNVLHPSPESAHSITYRRLDWLRHDIENVVFPRLKRLLGFEGENLLLDLFAYDNAGNITSMRARIFDTSANCNAATPDLDATDTPAPGELWTYTITQAHNLPRNTRTEHKSVMDYNGSTLHVDESAVTDNYKETDVVKAPRNTGGWPNEGQ